MHIGKGNALWVRNATWLSHNAKADVVIRNSRCHIAMLQAGISRWRARRGACTYIRSTMSSEANAIAEYANNYTINSTVS